jgi:hypothetical protein
MLRSNKGTRLDSDEIDSKAWRVLDVTHLKILLGNGKIGKFNKKPAHT